MTIVTIRPDGSTSSSGTSINGGAADNDDALRRTSSSDHSTATSVLFGASGTLIVTLANMPALGANQRIARVRVRMGLALAAAGGTMSGYVRVNAIDAISIGVVTNFSGYKEITGDWVTTNPNTGLEWTETAVNAASLKLLQSAAGSPVVYWAELDIDVRDQPVLAVSVPAVGEKVDPALGTGSVRGPYVFRWLYLNYIPYRYQLKIFTAAVVGGGGFDPNTSTSIYSSGALQTGTNQHAIPLGTLALTPGASYYVYILATTQFPGPTTTEWSSDWTGRQFNAGSAPVVTVSAPTGVQATAQPTITYAYSDADGKVNPVFLIRIFERPGGSWTGFDSDDPANIPVYINEDLSLTTHVMSYAALAQPKTYRAYVKAMVASPFEIDGEGFSDFTTAWTPPTTPTLTATTDPVNARMVLVATNKENHASARVTIERSLDGGQTWAKVRGIDAVNIGFNVATTFYDYEATPRQAVRYRAWATSTASGVITQSAFAIPADVMLNTKYNFLKDPTTPARNIHAVTQGEWLERNHTRDRAFYRAIGRTRPIPMRGTQSGDTFTVQMVTKNAAERTAMDLLLESDRVLIWQTTRTLQYVEVSGDYTDNEYMWADLHGESGFASRIYTVSFTEVDPV